MAFELKKSSIPHLLGANQDRSHPFNFDHLFVPKCLKIKRA
jgi:hypothetical protein